MPTAKPKTAKPDAAGLQRTKTCRRVAAFSAASLTRGGVHHVAKLADLGGPGDRPPWADLMPRGTANPL